MLDCRTLDILSAAAESFEIHHNAHRESDTSIARHLLHRERLGDKIVFAGHEGKAACIDADVLWELSIHEKAGGYIHIAGPMLETCLQIALATLSHSVTRAIAA